MKGRVEIMEKGNVTRYFLGANSRYGFYSLYDGFTSPASGDFLWVIKGGPGCGKSSFMKKIGAAAEEHGLPVEYIHCSGDPDSLDGVRLPTLRTAYADGTAPHVIESVYPGAASLYLDLGTFYDAGALETELDAIVDINRRYKRLYDRAYACIAASAGVSPRSIPGLYGAAETEKVRRKLHSFAAREFKGDGSGSAVKRRFLSAVSCKGRVFFSDTVKALGRRVYAVDNEYGLADSFLSGVAALAEENGCASVLCPDPIDPETLEAVLLPELSLALLATDGKTGYDGEIDRHIRLDALIEKDAAAALRPEVRKARKLSGELLDYGIETLAKAKALHDELEKIYNPHVDFDGLYAVAADHIAWLLDGV